MSCLWKSDFVNPSHRNYYSVSNLKGKGLLGQLGNQLALSTGTRVLAEKICKLKKRGQEEITLFC